MDAQPVEALKLLGAIAKSRGELERAIEIAQLPDSVKLEDLSEQLEDFAHTAAAIAELNLVISVDTSVSHLAGSLGKPVWVLLAFAPDWRWMLEREDSPWYSTMRLFRQSQAGDWSGVFERVAIALKNYRDSQMSESEKGEIPQSEIEHRLPTIGSSSPDELLKIAAENYHAGRLKEAEAICRQVIDRQPEIPGALLLLGAIAYRHKKVEEAITLYRQSLRFMPNNAETHNNLAVALKEQGKVEEAAIHYQQALALKPDYAEAWHNIGLLFGGGGKFADASFCSQKAVDFKPDWADARNSLATSLKEEGKLAEAMAHYNKALELDPNHINARCGRADVLLRTGNLLQGFSEYEWRLRHKDCPSRGLSEPLWDGSKAECKTILLHTEQGLGDAIQFIRYVTLVRERCARVVVECNQKSLRRLLATAAGVDDILVRGEALPEFDFQAPLMSLPKILGTTLETLPAQIPYLSVPDSATLKLPVAPAAGVRVGVVWAANALNKTAAKRSCTLSLFQKVLDPNGGTFYSLQKELQPAEIELLNSRKKVYNLKNSLYDLAETAAAISQLDLVISADTAVAHLAGALGKPVWVLLPFHADWRWLENRSDTPWYPTMRLFRQSAPDRWEEVLERVVGELQVLASEHRHSQQETAGGEVPVSPAVGGAKNKAGEPAATGGGRVHAGVGGAENILGEPAPTTGGFNRLKKCRYGVMIYNANDIYIGRSLDLYGEYSEGEVELFKQILRPGDVAVDAGANIGAHTVYFAQAVGERGAVLAFEPQRIVFQTLCANIALNSITNTYCYSVALGSTPGSIRVPPLNYSQLNNFGGLALGGYSAGEPVEVRTLDSFALEKCRLIKIDVEGMELQVLQGAVKTVEKFKPALYVENDRQEKAAALIRYLDSIGYAMYWHRPTYYNPNNFLGNRDNVFGRTISVNMLCVHRQYNPNVRGLEPVVVPR
ncbi:MAG: FkbM family methyltransferase [Oscillatoria sp. Prado101]|nr:FkbM family methyltransferase [Oscillatoria sp. Prado101]